jgi:hypothetical protein
MLWLALLGPSAAGADCFAGYPAQYVTPRRGGEIHLDGALDEAAWTAAAWTPEFADIRGDTAPRPRFHTRAKVLWDDEFLYVGAELQERHIWANITQDNEVIFHDNDFEVFIDPTGTTHEYRELEVNALGKQWSLRLNKPYSDGGAEDSRRVKPDGFDLEATVAVHVDGAVNRPDVRSKRWTVETAIPVRQIGGPPPRVGGFWRINFSRVQWRVRVDGDRYLKQPGPEDNWVYGPMGLVNMHLPERWPILQFAESGGATVVRDPSWPARHAVAAVYDAEHKRKGAGFAPLSQLELPSLCADLHVDAVAKDFNASATYDGYTARIRADRYLTVEPSPRLSADL